MRPRLAASSLKQPSLAVDMAPWILLSPHRPRTTLSHEQHDNPTDSPDLLIF